MNLGISGRVALVTGASRGIGRAIALALAKEGARTIVVARSKDLLESVKKEMSGGQGRHICIPLDLQLADGPSRLNDILNENGVAPEIIVHNLGGSLGVTQTFAPVDDWKTVWHFNVGVAHELNRLLIPHMIDRKWGRIVHLSTLATSTHDGYAAYTSAKSALDGYVKVVSREVSKHNVLLNAIAPGLVYLEGRHYAKLQRENPEELEKYFDNHLPMRRMASAEEIATVVSFLCSEHAAYMSGSIVRVDGGGH